MNKSKLVWNRPFVISQGRFLLNQNVSGRSLIDLQPIRANNIGHDAELIMTAEHALLKHRSRGSLLAPNQ